MRVRCVNTGKISTVLPSGETKTSWVILIKENKIYNVIRHVIDQTTQKPCYELAEVDASYDGTRVHYYVERFVPITDISILMRMTKVRELEDA